MVKNMLRDNTNVVRIRNKLLGGKNKILVQTMAKTKTSNTEAIIKLANDLYIAGADLLRVSILDEHDAKSLKTIVDNSPLPIIADLHFNKDLALKSIDNGADKIRINPGNFHQDDLKEIIERAKYFNIPIRIGINSGSLSLNQTKDTSSINEYFSLLDSTIDIFKKYDYDKNLVLALKSTDPNLTFKLYRAAAELYPYPLHIGLTESGFGPVGAIRSSICLVPLLQLGIGNTIRISLSDSPITEVETVNALLKGLGLKNDVPTLITCPTCGRTQCDVSNLAKRISELLLPIEADIKVAIMGCPVNGPGEAKDADFGLAGTKNAYLTFESGKKGTILKEEEAYQWMKNKLSSFKKRCI